MKPNNNISLINKIHKNIMDQTKILQLITILFNTTKTMSSLKIIRFPKVINKFK